MNLKRYIKVTTPDTKKSVVLLATNEEFYLRQGATITEPTEEEVLKAFPGLQKFVTPKPTKKTKLSKEDINL